MEMGALFDANRYRRFKLWRIWDPDLPTMTTIGLNPSTADETQNDPTVTRCINRAHDLGLGGLIMLNVFSYRATDPKELWDAAEWGGIDIEGEGNRAAFEGISQSGVVLAAWGVGGARYRQGERVGLWLRSEGAEPKCLGTTKDGHPRHPLYVARDKELEPFDAAAALYR